MGMMNDSKTTHDIKYNNLPKLPCGWAWTITSEVCASVRDGTHDTPKYIIDGVPLVTSKNLRKNCIDFSTTKNISLEDHKQISLRSGVERGDILLAMIGTIGNPVVVDTEIKFSIKNVALFKKNELAIKSKYLKLWLESRLLINILENEDFLKGSTQKFIPLKYLRILPVPLPPLNEQRRIVAKLEKLLTKVDTCKERLDKIPAILKRFRQSVLSAACSGRLTADWRENNPDVESAEELLKRIQEERIKRYKEECENAKKEGRRKPKRLETSDFEVLKLPSMQAFELPPNWTLCNCRTISDFITDGEHSTPQRSDNGILLLSARNIQNGYLKLEKVDYIPDYEYQRIIQRCYPQKDDILISCSGSVGRICRVPDNLKFTMVRSVALLKLQYNLELSSYLELALQSRIIQDQILHLQKATAQANLFIGQIGKIVVLLPPLPEQQEIVRRVETLFKTADRIEQRYQKARTYIDQLTQSILSQAFRGELVPQDPNDEPASVLLEQIRAERENREKVAKTAKKPAKKRSKKAKPPLEPIQLELPGMESNF